MRRFTKLLTRERLHAERRVAAAEGLNAPTPKDPTAALERATFMGLSLAVRQSFGFWRSGQQLLFASSGAQGFLPWVCACVCVYVCIYIYI
jgi:hypothetical protein